MSDFFLERGANHALDEIYEYTAVNWGEEQADAYIDGLFRYFRDIAAKSVTWRTIPADLGVAGYFGRYEHHFVYWTLMRTGNIGIVAILHERMHRIDRIRELFD